MRRWLQPARTLPVTLRPIGGETVNSYTLRLSAANGLIPTAILRSLGQFTERSGHLLARDSWLNDQALARLEAFSAISRPRLLRALPALRQGPPSSRPGPLPGDRPALHCYIPQPRPWPACRLCTLRASLGTTPSALVRPPLSPLICSRHQRWLGTSDEPADTGISAVPEILTAYRRFQRLRSSSDPQMAADCIQAAWNITRAWAREPHCRPRLRARWRSRAGNSSRTRHSAPPRSPSPKPSHSPRSSPTRPGATTWQQPGKTASSTGASPPGSAKAPTRHPPTTTRSSPGPATTAASLSQSRKSATSNDKDERRQARQQMANHRSAATQLARSNDKSQPPSRLGSL